MSALSNLTPGTWNIDPAHSRVGFVARHLMIAKVRGSFSSFSGAITVGEKIGDSKVEAVIELKSVSTGDAGRDGHLLTADFFNVEANPTMSFVSTSIEAEGDEGEMTGDLTIAGVTHPVTFQVEFEGVNGDPWGGTRAGFSAVAEINRKDWGLEYNMVLEAGGVVIGERVKIELDVEAIRA
jgi:polyisoprenoid-binding protein YceI